MKGRAKSENQRRERSARREAVSREVWVWEGARQEVPSRGRDQARIESLTQFKAGAHALRDVLERELLVPKRGKMRDS